MNNPFSVLTRQPVMVALEALVLAGPETAAKLGVPVGAAVDYRHVRHYRNPFRQLLWSLRHRDGNVR